MTTILEILTAELGIPPKVRYTVEEVATILGINRDQVTELLRAGKLAGWRVTERRWGGIFADDLDAFLQAVNAPRFKVRMPSTLVPRSSPAVNPPPPLFIPARSPELETVPVVPLPAPTVTAKPKLNF